MAIKRLIVASGLFSFGLLFLLSSSSTITASVIGSPVSPLDSSLIGVFLMIVSAGLILTAHSKEKKIRVSSAIKDDRSICRLAEEATRNQDVQGDIDHLIHELSRGNLEAGMGYSHIDGTDIFYMRGRRGGRLYYHKIGEDSGAASYEIVGKSSKSNQDRVIRKLRERYSR